MAVRQKRAPNNLRSDGDIYLKDDFRLSDGLLKSASGITNQESLCVVYLLVSTLVLWLVYWNKRSGETQADNRPEVKSGRARLPPGRSGWPLIGETIEFVADGRKFFRTRREKYGSVFRTHLCGLPTVVVIGGENVQKVLTASESTLVQSSPSSFLQLFGRGALTSTVGRRHALLQKAVMKLFTPRHLGLFVAPVQKVIREHVARWSNACGVVDGVDACREMSLSIVCQCLFGFDLDAKDAEGVARLTKTFADGVFAFPVKLPGFGFYKAMQARDGLRQFMTSGSRTGSRLSMLDLLHSVGADDPEVVGGAEEDVPDLVLELFFGANLSTASAMCTAIIELSKNLEVLGKVRRELQGRGITPGDYVDYDVINSLSYTNDVIKEVLRIQPPVAGAFRRTVKPFRIQDYVIPAGWMVLYGITDTHEASFSFDKVENFNPDRWQHLRLCTMRTPTSMTSSGELRTATTAEHRPTVTSEQTTKLTSQQTTQQTMQQTAPEMTRQMMSEQTTKVATKQMTQQMTSEQTTQEATKQMTQHMTSEQTTQETTKQMTQHMTSEQTTQEATKQMTQQMTSEQTMQPTEPTAVNKYEYIPFGGGGRRFCVGESLARTILVLFLVELVNGTKGWTLTNGTPEIRTAPIPFPKDGLPILFHQGHDLRPR